MKDDRKEYLFRAIGDVGGDLVDKAEKQVFPRSPWRRWAALAACMALVVSLGVLALPYLPMGCGSSAGKSFDTAENAVAAEAPETPAETAPEAAEPPADAGGASNEEADGVEAPQDPAEAPQKALRAEARPRLVFRSTYYYLTPLEPVPAETPPENLGAALGTVEASEDDSLTGCTVYAIPYTTEYTNHSVDGQPAPGEVYVLTPEGYAVAGTFNEKTVSRYTFDEARQAAENGDSQWLLETFVLDLERREVADFTDSAALTGEDLNRLFLATVAMNTGVVPDRFWVSDDAAEWIVPADDVTWRLSRFLDEYAYLPEETAAWDRARGALVWDTEAVYEVWNQQLDLRLRQADVLDGDTLVLQVERGTDGGGTVVREYTIRFDADSWRYQSIVTIGD